ncbi:unnamed protein product [Rotaria sp. Silwood1]|nr:unnamed protein product [Rotaria sp. Silwood1]CAF3527887.1 unnamed protein product [Rotaria sp. Silwood1]CAF3593413.1 unnamed protein product [Rotaria sp. Silwood1]CAF4854834.1 unnamed protein product [Rotaria sp. Silwood1]CAF4866911.1 unnamed protein product [Rotaria sp. Silwood1]
MFPSLIHKPPSISTLPKINLIELPPLTPKKQPLEQSTKAVLSNMLPQSDYLTIYNGLTSLSNLCKQIYNKEPYFWWMSPDPSNLPIYEQKQIDFKKCVDDIDNIVISEGFFKFDRFDIWSRLKHLVIVNHGHFSLHGRPILNIRDDYELLSRAQAQELEEYYRIQTEQIREEIIQENERKRLLASENDKTKINLKSLSLRNSIKD